MLHQLGTVLSLNQGLFVVTCYAYFGSNDPQGYGLQELNPWELRSSPYTAARASEDHQNQYLVLKHEECQGEVVGFFNFQFVSEEMRNKFVKAAGYDVAVGASVPATFVVKKD